MLFALEYPEIVSSMVIEDSGFSPLMRNEGATTPIPHREVEFLRSLKGKYESENELAAALLPICDGKIERAELLAKKIFPVGTRRSAVIQEFWQEFKAYDLSAFPRAFRKPVLFLRAAPPTRYFIEADRHMIETLMPQFTIVSFPNATHLIHEKQPLPWLQAVVPFIDNFGGSPKGVPRDREHVYLNVHHPNSVQFRR